MRAARPIAIAAAVLVALMAGSTARFSIRLWRVRPAAAVVVLVLLAALLPAGAGAQDPINGETGLGSNSDGLRAEGTEQGAVWSAEMVVGEPGQSRGHDYLGYSFFKRSGALEPTGFDYGGERVTVLALAYSATAQKLGLAASAELADELVLQVGGVEFELGEADVRRSPHVTHVVHEWDTSVLDWAVGDSFDVALAVPPPAIPEDPEETVTSEETEPEATAPPTPPPANLRAWANANGTITLRWDAPDDETVDGYRILRRRPTEGQDELEVHVDDTGTVETTYVDTTIVSSVRHTYRVKALYGEDESEESNYATTVARTPGQPRNLTAAVNEDGSITLNWDAPGYDGIAGYRILRRRPSLGEVVLEVHDADTESAETAYTDTRVTTGTRHVYRVAAVIVGGRLSETSNSARAVPLAPPPPPENPSIAGVAGDPTALRASVADITSAPQDAEFAYQWVAVSGDAESDIDGATGQAYRADLADGYDAYRVRVSYTDGRGQQQTLTSGATPIRQHVVSHAAAMPDLASAAPGQAELVSAGAGEVRLLPADGTDQARTNEQPMLLLRFASSIDNIGNGPLDVAGNPRLADPSDDTSHDAWQRTRTSDDGWVSLTRPPIRYETADGHDHFHIMGVAEYSLWDEAGQTRVLTSPKAGFCLVDSYPLNGRTPPSGENQYHGDCGRGSPGAAELRMGISAGMQDLYRRDMAFQWVDVSDVAPGRYRLAGQTDPDDAIWESDETNNGVVLSQQVQTVPGYVAVAQNVQAQPGANAVILRANTYGTPGALRFRVVKEPSNGTLDVELNAALDRATVTYTPDERFAGRDSFEFEAFDETSEFPRTPARATVAIQVEAAADQTPKAPGGSGADQTPKAPGGSGADQTPKAPGGSGADQAPKAPGGSGADPPPLTASLEQVPHAHDGSSEFSVRLILSEEVPLSYITVRDAVFDVAAGTVVGASRLTRGSNRGWVVRIQPAGRADVRVAVAAGGPCSRNGAICADDGRALSTPLEAVIRGP